MYGRVQKIIANHGICSRRKAEQLIKDFKVSVNGKPVRIGDSADSEKDIIMVDGVRLRQPKKIYVILNKPVGVETTLKSESHKPTVIDLVKIRERLIPAGRLDVDSRGLVFLTNDGEIANRVMHPRYVIDKIYYVKIKEIVPDEVIDRLRNGVKLDDGITAPAEVKVLSRHYRTTELSMKIHEGRKRQIRRMIEEVGFKVLDLARTRVGPLTLRGVSEGKFRELRKKELKELRTALGMTK
jgi:23S rRNA pseudouridine2605 synthase